MVTNEPTSPSAPSSSWATGVAWHSPVVSPSEPGGGQPETPDPIVSPGVADGTAYGDDVSGSVGAAVLAAEARFGAHQQDTYQQGSQIGVRLVLPEVPTAHSKHAGGDGDGYAAG